MKKVLSVLLVVAMLFAISASAFAAEATTSDVEKAQQDLAAAQQALKEAEAAAKEAAEAAQKAADEAKAAADAAKDLATKNQAATGFADVSGNEKEQLWWAKYAIEWGPKEADEKTGEPLNKEKNPKAGLIKGYVEGDEEKFTYFKGENNITRAEVAQILFNMSQRDLLDLKQINPNDLTKFSDVQLFEGKTTTPYWYVEALSAMVGAGILQGRGNGLLGPNDNITREEFFTVLARAFYGDQTPSTALKFTDAADVASYATGNIALLVAQGVVNGYPDGTILPKNNIKRGEVLKTLDSIYGTEKATITAGGDLKISADDKYNLTITYTGEAKNDKVEIKSNGGALSFNYDTTVDGLEKVDFTKQIDGEKANGSFQFTVGDNTVTYGVDGREGYIRAYATDPETSNKAYMALADLFEAGTGIKLPVGTIIQVGDEAIELSKEYTATKIDFKALIENAKGYADAKAAAEAAAKKAAAEEKKTLTDAELDKIGKDAAIAAVITKTSDNKVAIYLPKDGVAFGLKAKSVAGSQIAISGYSTAITGALTDLVNGKTTTVEKTFVSALNAALTETGVVISVKNAAIVL